MKYFDLEFETDKPPTTVRRELLSVWTGELAGVGYSLSSQSDIGVTYSRKYRRWYIIALAILLFPIGLLFLFAADEATIAATIDQDDDSGHTILIVNGTGPKNVRQGLAEMEI